MQLVAYGSQDVYLTGDPKVTFFKSVYSRHTLFAMEAIKLTLQGSIGNGNFIQVVVGRDGDLIHDMWVELAPILTASPVWLAERAFKSIELTIGGQRIDKHYQTWFRLWAEVFQNESQKLKYGKITSLGNSTADTSTPNTVTLPLLFFFNKDPGLALPLIALQYHEVRIIFELADDYLSYFSVNNFVVWGNYMFLDVKERQMFGKKNHEYLIEQVQHNGGDVITAGSLNPSFRVPFQHPVKELIWCFQNPTRTGTKMWNFCIDTANVYATTAQTSNISPHMYGSPIINTLSPVQGVNDAGTSFSPLAPQGQFGYSVSISSDGTAYAEGAPNASSSAGAANATAGSAKVYRYTNGAWDTGSFLNPATEPSTGSLYGTSVAISPDGTHAVVGSPATSSSTGTMYSFEYINNSWSSWAVQTGSGTGAKFGTSLAITNGGRVASGAPGKTTNTGEVLVYNVNNAGGFTAVGSALPVSGAQTDYFGTSVSLDSTGTILAVGAPQISTTTVLTTVSGTTTTFTYLTSNTTPTTGGAFIVTISASAAVTGTMTIGGAALSTLVGTSYYLTGLSATTASLYAIGPDGLSTGSALVIGNGTSTGAIFTYYAINTVLTTVSGATTTFTYLTSNTTPSTGGTFIVTISGTPTGTMTIGGAALSTLSGTSYYLTGINSTTASLYAIDPTNGSKGASALSIGNGTSTGAVFTYYSIGYSKIYRLVAGTWTADTTAPMFGTTNSLFGTSVSLNAAGNILAVGAPNITTGSGYVKIFTYSSSAWSFTAKIITSSASDTFGTSVSLNPAGTSLVIGSPSGGYVRVYQSSAGVWPAYAGNTYGYTDATTSSKFGQSVAISQSLVIGAPALSSASTPVNYVKLYAPTLTLYKTWVEEGGETSTITTGPLSSLNIDLNGQSRFFPQNGKYFNQYQPLKYHTGSPYPGIYCYSFALKPELNQPSGTCNFSRIDNSQINIVLKNLMYTPCNLKLFAINYNILRYQSGMAGLAFSN